MRINPFIIRLIGDAVLPLLGYFFWHWSLFFILLYYLLDLVASEIIVHFKARKIFQENSNSRKVINKEFKSPLKNWLWGGLLSFAFLGFLFFVIIQFMHLRTTNFSFKNEFIAFMSYKDMGVAQGYLLLPLIFFVSFQNYKMEFLMPARYRKLTITNLWKNHLIALGIVLIFASLALLLQLFILIPDLVIILFIILLTSLYSLFIKRFKV